MNPVKFVLLALIIIFGAMAGVVVVADIVEKQSTNGRHAFVMEEIQPPGPATYMNGTMTGASP